MTIISLSLPQKFRPGTKKYFSVSLQVARPASYKLRSAQLPLFSVTGGAREPEREREGGGAAREEELCSRSRIEGTSW